MALQTYKLNDVFSSLSSMPGWQWRLEATVMPLKRNERALQLWMVFTVTRHNENQGTSKVEYKIAALWALFFRGWRLPYALSSKSSHTSHLKLKTPDWGELMVCQWRIEAIEAGKTEEKNFTSWFGVCMVLVVWNPGQWSDTSTWRRTENFCSVCLARHSNVPCKKQRSGLGATVIKESQVVLSDSLILVEA